MAKKIKKQVRKLLTKKAKEPGLRAKYDALRAAVLSRPCCSNHINPVATCEGCDRAYHAQLEAAVQDQ